MQEWRHLSHQVYTHKQYHLSVFCKDKGGSPIMRNFETFPKLTPPLLTCLGKRSPMFPNVCKYLHLAFFILMNPNFQHFGLPMPLPPPVCRTPLREQNRRVHPRYYQLNQVTSCAAYKTFPPLVHPPDHLQVKSQAVYPWSK